MHTGVKFLETPVLKSLLLLWFQNIWWSNTCLDLMTMIRVTRLEVRVRPRSTIHSWVDGIYLGSSSPCNVMSWYRKDQARPINVTSTSAARTSVRYTADTRTEVSCRWRWTLAIFCIILVIIGWKLSRNTSPNYLNHMYRTQVGKSTPMLHGQMLKRRDCIITTTL